MIQLLLSVFLFAVFCNSAFGIGPNLYPIRLVLPVVLVYFSILFFQKIILLKEKLRIEPLVLFTFLFFIFMFFHTALVTYLRYDLLSVDYDINSLLNYGFLVMLIIGIYLSFLAVKDQFFVVLNRVVMSSYIAYLVFAIYEIITGNHLPVSNLVNSPWWMSHVPTVVYYNSNDFAAIFTIMFAYIISVYDQKRTTPALIIIGVFVIHIVIAYFSMSRLAFIISILFYLYRYPKYFFQTILLAIPVGLIFIGLVNESQLMQAYDSFVGLKNDLSFSERESTSVRLQLYKYALLSPLSNFGMGFGIDASEAFYRSIQDPNLHFIVNPHSYIFELLINSGVFATLIYVFINAYLIIKKLIYKQHDMMIQVVLYNLLLFSSSSSLFLWPTYLFFIVYICKTSYTIRLFEKKSKN